MCMCMCIFVCVCVFVCVYVCVCAWTVSSWSTNDNGAQCMRGMLVSTMGMLMCDMLLLCNMLLDAKADVMS